ncbi:MAG: chemotaxis protein CheB, partial [Sulfurifustaceae bacterium]
MHATLPREPVQHVEHPAKPAAESVERTAPASPIVVGIGASAGGLEALGSLLSHLPHDTNMAFVVVQHLAPGHESLMTELLARKTRMKVLQVRDGMRMEANGIYVIPPNYDLGVLHGTLQLFNRPERQRPHLPVDYFFRALAQDQGNKAIGVVLSGSGSDGTLGLVAIKAEGGITIAQDPKTAQYDGMPRSAIGAGCIDLVRSPEGIARELTEIASHPYVRRETVDESLVGTALNKVFFQLRRVTGHDFSSYKRTTISRRLSRRMVLHKLNRIEDYVRYLEESPREVDELFHDLLINVTGFFRDPETFDALKTTVFPRLIERRQGDEALRVWVPACSTGEEVYSVAIALIEQLGRDWKANAIQIFASDIDDKAIDKARVGFYPENIQAHVSDERLSRFFTARPGGYQINKAIRDLCVFSMQDVVQDPPFSRMDLVACRNLLIYLDATLQRKVLARLHFALKADGFLVLGASETVGGSEDLFALVDKKNKIYSKKPTRPPSRDVAQIRAIQPPVRAEARPVHGRMTRNLQQEAEQLIVRSYGPPTVIINEGMDIIGFSGQTGAYIEPAPGAVSLKLLKMVNADLGVSVRDAVLRAIKQKATARADGAHFRHGDQERFVNIVVMPLQSSSSAERHYAVMFEPTSKSDSARRKALHSEKGGTKDRRIRALMSELETAHRETQNLVGDYTTAIEELQAANEEIQSSAEEMQSTNEELESAKEELQSTNEELSTINEELENRNHELTEVNNDLANLLNSIDLPIVMLGDDLCIRRITPMAKNLFNLIESDIGRPIGNFKSNLDVPNLERVVAEVMEQKASRSIETEDNNGRSYSVRIRPYKTTENRIAGVVLVCIDITEEIRSLKSLKRLAAVVRDSNDAVLVQDLKGDIRAWNPRAERLYGYSEAEALKMNVREVIPREAQDFHDQMVQRLLEKELAEPIKTTRLAKDGRTVSVSVTAS